MKAIERSQAAFFKQGHSLVMTTAAMSSETREAHA